MEERKLANYHIGEFLTDFEDDDFPTTFSKGDSVYIVAVINNDYDEPLKCVVLTKDLSTATVVPCPIMAIKGQGFNLPTFKASFSH